MELISRTQESAALARSRGQGKNSNSRIVLPDTTVCQRPRRLRHLAVPLQREGRVVGAVGVVAGEDGLLVGSLERRSCGPRNVLTRGFEKDWIAREGAILVHWLCSGGDGQVDCDKEIAEELHGGWNVLMLYERGS